MVQRAIAFTTTFTVDALIAISLFYEFFRVNYFPSVEELNHKTLPAALDSLLVYLPSPPDYPLFH